MKHSDDETRRKTDTGKASEASWARRGLLLVSFIFGLLAAYRYGVYVERGRQVLQVGEAMQLAVHVKGAVEAPGLYLFTANQRVADAVQAAGPLPEADLNRINLAAYLTDGAQLLVPYAESEADDGRLNLNTASREQLESLPGIGPQKATAILRYREENGAFTAPEDLLQIDGISRETLTDLESRVCVR